MQLGAKTGCKCFKEIKLLIYKSTDIHNIISLEEVGLNRSRYTNPKHLPTPYLARDVCGF